MQHRYRWHPSIARMLNGAFIVSEGGDAYRETRSEVWRHQDFHRAWLTAQTHATQATNDRGGEVSTKDFADKFIGAEDMAWQKGDFSALEQLEDANVIYHTPPIPDQVGREAHKQYILGTRMAVSDLHQDWEYITGDGNVFALSYQMKAKWTGQIPGMPPPTGKEITNNSIFVFLLKDGKIAQAWSRGTMTGLT